MKIVIAFLLTAGGAFAQCGGAWADFTSSTAATNLSTAINAKANVRCSATSPVGVLAGTQGQDFVVGTGAIAGDVYVATVTGSPATWVRVNGTAGTNGSNGAAGAGYLATSATSLVTAGSGSKSFTTQAGLAYTTGARIRATSAGTAEYMEGLVTSYSTTTLVATMDRNSGTGTHADWNINLVGDVGATGSSGGGSGDVLGPATNSDSFIPQWNGANSKTLKAGLAVSATATANAVAQRNASGEVIAPNTVAAGKTAVDLDTAQTLAGKTLDSPALAVGTPITIPFTANAAGVTTALLAIGVVNGTATEAKTAAVSDVGVVGIAMSTATSGTVQIATRGETLCLFENTAVANEIVVVGTGTAGNCRSSGQTNSNSIANNVQIIGRVLAGGAAGNRMIQVFGPGHYGAQVVAAGVTAALDTRSITITMGANNGSALLALDIAPQMKQWGAPVAIHIIEVSVDSDAGTSSVQVQKRHCSTITSGACTAWTNTNILTGELATLTGGFPACARSATSATCIVGGGVTSSSSITLTGAATVAVAAGDYIETSTSTLAGAPKLYSVTLTYTVD